MASFQIDIVINTGRVPQRLSLIEARLRRIEERADRLRRSLANIFNIPSAQFSQRLRGINSQLSTLARNANVANASLNGIFSSATAAGGSAINTQIQAVNRTLNETTRQSAATATGLGSLRTSTQATATAFGVLRTSGQATFRTLNTLNGTARVSGAGLSSLGQTSLATSSALNNLSMSGQATFRILNPLNVTANTTAGAMGNLQRGTLNASGGAATLAREATTARVAVDRLAGAAARAGAATGAARAGGAFVPITGTGTGTRRGGADATALRVSEVRNQIAELGQRLFNIRRLFLGITTLAGTAIIVRGVANLLDTYTNLENRLRFVSRGVARTSQTFEQIREVSDRTRSSFEATAQIFTRTALSAQSLGVSQEELINFTESLNQATILSGASVREANAALIQLSQGIASNTLRGDELRSVLEQLPVVADVIARSMGATRGELRALAEQGLISAGVILRAFREARVELADQFAETIPTLGQSFTVLFNAIIDTFGRFDRAIGLTNALSAAMNALGRNMDALVVILGLLVGGAGLVLLSFLVRRVVLGFLDLGGRVDATGRRISIFGRILTTLGGPAGILFSLVSVLALVVAGTDRVGASVDGVGDRIRRFNRPFIEGRQVIEDYAQALREVARIQSQNIFQRVGESFGIGGPGQAPTVDGFQVSFTRQQENFVALIGAAESGIDEANARLEQLERALTRGPQATERERLLRDIGRVTAARDELVEARFDLADQFRASIDAPLFTGITPDFLDDTTFDIAERANEAALQQLSQNQEAQLLLFNRSTDEYLERYQDFYDRIQEIRTLGERDQPDETQRLIDQSLEVIDQTVLNRAELIADASNERLATIRRLAQLELDQLDPQTLGADPLSFDEELIRRNLAEAERVEFRRTTAEDRTLGREIVGNVLQETGARQRLNEILDETIALRDREIDFGLIRQYEQSIDLLREQIRLTDGVAAAIQNFDDQIRVAQQSTEVARQVEQIVIDLERRGVEVDRQARNRLTQRAEELAELQRNAEAAGEAFTALEDIIRGLDDQIRVARIADPIGRQVEQDIIQLERAAAENNENINIPLAREQIALRRQTLSQLERQEQILTDLQGPLFEFEQRQRAINTLFAQGAISQEQYNIAIENLRLDELSRQTDALSGLERGFIRIRQQARDLATVMETVVVSAFREAEDVFVNFVQTGELSFDRLIDTVLEELLRLSFRSLVNDILNFFGFNLDPIDYTRLNQSFQLHVNAMHTVLQGHVTAFAQACQQCMGCSGSPPPPPPPRQPGMGPPLPPQGPQIPLPPQIPAPPMPNLPPAQSQPGIFSQIGSAISDAFNSFVNFVRGLFQSTPQSNAPQSNTLQARRLIRTENGLEFFTYDPNRTSPIDNQPRGPLVIDPIGQYPSDGGRVLERPPPEGRRRLSSSAIIAREEARLAVLGRRATRRPNPQGDFPVLTPGINPVVANTMAVEELTDVLTGDGPTLGRPNPQGGFPVSTPPFVPSDDQTIRNFLDSTERINDLFLTDLDAILRNSNDDLGANLTDLINTLASIPPITTPPFVPGTVPSGGGGGGGGGFDFGDIFDIVRDFPIPFFHKGGVVGYSNPRRRGLPASLFANAPRLHDGLGEDEFPAILQRGERVIPRGSTGNPASSNVNVQIIDQRTNPDSEPVQTRTSAGPSGERNIEVIVRDIVRNEAAAGGLDRPLQNRFGLRPAITGRS